MAGLEFRLYPMMQVVFHVKTDSFAAGVLIAGIYQLGGLHT